MCVRTHPPYLSDQPEVRAVGCALEGHSLKQVRGSCSGWGLVHATSINVHSHRGSWALQESEPKEGKN